MMCDVKYIVYATKNNDKNISHITHHTSHIRKMYIIKVKGKAKIPDYVQLRDDNFVLIAYFRADRPLKNLDRYELEGKEDYLRNLIDTLPFGKLEKLEI